MIVPLELARHMRRRTFVPPIWVGIHPTETSVNRRYEVLRREFRFPLFTSAFFTRHSWKADDESSTANPRTEIRAKRKGHPATGRPSLQGRIVPTEAIDSVKTFCGNLMSLKTRVSSDFWEINHCLFNNLQKVLTGSESDPKSPKIAWERS